MGILSLLFGGGKSGKSTEDDPKGYYEDPKDPGNLGRDAAEAHQSWLDERSKDP